MTTDPRAGERAALGGRARELMNSPIFAEAIEALDTEYRNATFATKAEDRDKREALFLEYNALRRIVKRLRDWEADGVMAQREIEADK